MSIEAIKQELVLFSIAEQQEVVAFLFHLRHAHDSEYQSVITERLAERDISKWITLEEFEKRLGRQ